MGRTQSVGRSIRVDHDSVGLAQARPKYEKSTVQLTSVGLVQARPNYSERSEAIYSGPIEIFRPRRRCQPEGGLKTPISPQL